MEKRRGRTSDGCRGVHARNTLTKFLSHLDVRLGKVTLPQRVIELFDILSGVSLLYSRADVRPAFAELHFPRLFSPLFSSVHTLLLSVRRDRLPGRFGDLLITPRGGKKELNRRTEAKRTSDAFETSRDPSFLCRFIFLSLLLVSLLTLPV